MSADLAKYKKLCEDVEVAKSAVDQAKGGLDELLKRLKTEFKCNNIKEAKALLAELEAQQAELEEEFNNGLKQFEEEVGPLLEKTESD